MRTTEWFPSNVPPVRTGWYEVMGSNYSTRLWFDAMTGKWLYNPRVRTPIPVDNRWGIAWCGLAAPAIEQTLDRYFPSEEQQQELRELLMDANDKQIACNNAWMKLSSHLRTKGWI